MHHYTEKGLDEEGYREYIRDYLEAVQDNVSEDDIDFYVWLWNGAV